MLLYWSKKEPKQKDHKKPKQDVKKHQKYRRRNKWLFWIPAAFCVCVCVWERERGGYREKFKSQSSLSEQRVICASSLEAVSELLQVGNAIEMDERCCHDQNMKNLMRMELTERKMCILAAFIIICLVFKQTTKDTFQRLLLSITVPLVTHSLLNLQ